MIIDKINEIIDVDFQGWPIIKMSLRDMLVDLGFTEEKDDSGRIHFISPDENILDKYPITLEDDGMGYGINEKYICTAEYQDNSDKYPIKLFINPYNKERSDAIKEDLQEYTFKDDIDIKDDAGREK